jgi:tetratricopeptide (TPR) repeat protein
MTMTASFWCAGPAAAFGILPAQSPILAPFPSSTRAAVALAASSDPAHVRLAHARAALARGEVRAALVCFDESILLRADIPLAHLGRAMCLAELGDEPGASEALLDALALPDADGTVTMHLARMVAHEGAHQDAMDLLGAAFDIDPGLTQQALVDPAFGSLADHPRFLQMVGRL